MKTTLRSLRRWILQSLLAERDFRLMWASATITSFGGQITLLALPLTAVVLLNATPRQMGTMSALEALPFALFSLQAGVFLDRVRKQPILLWGEALIGLTLLTVPVMHFFGVLDMRVLYLVGFAMGIAFVVVGTAAQVYLTHVAGRARLIEANSLFTASDSAARLTGPGVAGLLIQCFGPPVAILLDCAGFIVSVALTSRIRHDEIPPASSGRVALLSEIRNGLAFVRHQPILRVLSVCACSWFFLLQGFLTLITLYASRTLLLSAGQIGLAHMLGGGGAMLAAIVAARVTRRFGMGAPVPVGICVSGAAWLATSLIAPGAYAFALLGLALFLFDFGITTYWINFSTLRQSVTPDAMLGRMTATMRFFTVAPAPFGAYLAGWLGETVGLRNTLSILGVCAMLLGLLALAFTNLRKVPDLSLGKVDAVPPALATESA